MYIHLCMCMIKIPSETFHCIPFQGAGLLGLYGCAVMSEYGWEKIFCTDISSDRLKFVPFFGGTPHNIGSYFSMIKNCLYRNIKKKLFWRATW